ncbi:hepatic lectin-like isoform X2 [Sceloporus undulatus]|uniref:hepatic lectin-like isoform X2 n=1 Tax=Sceloporus undulatus TaxID=8520 RepID=UPI001C4A909A|nr:hepatic lectin-like isoform X2 [Sceloporus undulatus]
MMVQDAVAYERQENTDKVHLEETGTAMASGTRGSRISSEVKKVHEQLPMKEGLFPCGSQSREWEYFHGRCYFFSTQKVVWHIAKDHCEEKNSTLVVVHNVAEQNFLQLQTKGERYWIGLNDLKAEGEWRWVDGTNYRTSFKNWKMGQPTDYERNEDCAEISVSGEWNDENCNRDNFYVCERPLPS